MEFSLIGGSQVNLVRNGDVGVFNFGKNLSAKICKLGTSNLKWPSKSGIGFTLRASAAAQSEVSKASKVTRTQHVDGVKLFVSLPLDTVSSSNTIKRRRAIAAGLKTLKLLGVDGVELPVWWGVAEKEMGEYQWTSYLAIVEMVRNLGLKLHVSLCFHASEGCKIPLPNWVSRIGEDEPSIYFADRSGQLFKDCLSFGVDDVPILDGKTPVQVYTEFCESFKSAFSSFMGSTITGISIGLGPDGELRYPSHHFAAKSSHGAGEFLCYDKYMLNNLKQQAETNGNPLWGLAGPHDAPNYGECPVSGRFLTENGGSWETPYGDFFLSWYSNQMISHGDRLLSLASSTFKNAGVFVSGKVPLVHSLYQTQSCTAELAAGFYNTGKRDIYEVIAKIFSRNSCRMMLPGMDLSDRPQSVKSQSNMESLLAQITSSCRKHGVEVLGQNSLVSGDSECFDQIRKNLVDEDRMVSMFIYQRMGAHFFSPEHFNAFAQLARALNQPSRSLDAMQVEEGRDIESPSGSDLHMQAA